MTTLLDLSKRMPVESFAAGSILLSEGASTGRLFVLVEGEVEILKKAGRATPEITRFKGLGEMMPKVLWETTLNPRTRRLLKVEVSDQLLTDRVINELMGKDASARFRFIMDRAEDAVELDV